MTAPSGEERAYRFMFFLLAFQRLSYLAPAAVNQASFSGYRSATLSYALLAGTLAWNGAVFWDAGRRGRFAGWMVWCDVLWAVVLAVLMTANSPAEAPFGAYNWSSRTSQAATALAGVAITPIPRACAAVAMLVATHTAISVAVSPGLPEPFLPGLIGYLNALVWYPIISGFSLRYLRRQGQLLDESTARRLAAESKRAADRARYAARLAHYRALHDTVLTTLTAIARGGLDHHAEQVRAKCARDADYLRRLLMDDPGAQASGTLGERLDEVIDGAEMLGLRVHHLRDVLPASLPDQVVAAFGDAAREALNNVAKHAGVTEAWLTTTWEDGTLRLRVVDRGAGFAVGETTMALGFGLRRSIIERTRRVGGEAIVTSGDEGTCVELTWTG